MITGAAVILQVLFGHRLPVIFGPSAILLTAAVAATDFAPAAFSTALVLCGAAGVVIAQTGLLAKLAMLFTPRVVRTVLMLIPLTLVPTFVSLIANPSQPGSAAGKLVFAFVVLIFLFAANHRLRGFWRATLMVWGLIVGTVAVLICFPGTVLSLGTGGSVPLTAGLLTSPVAAPGVLVSVFICYIALIVKDIGGIRGVATVAKSPAAESEGQLRHGVTITGIMNMISGGAGVIDGVNYSIPTGMIQDTKNASRYPLLVAGVVIDRVGTDPFTFDNGVVIGFSVLIAATFSFLPDVAVQSIPAVIRPVVAERVCGGNGCGDDS